MLVKCLRFVLGEESFLFNLLIFKSELLDLLFVLAHTVIIFIEVALPMLQVHLILEEYLFVRIYFGIQTLNLIVLIGNPIIVSLRLICNFGHHFICHLL